MSRPSGSRNRTGDYGDFELYRRAVGEARAYWPHIAGVFLIDLAAIPLALLLPLPLKIVVDSVIGSQPPPGFFGTLVPESLRGSSTGLLAAAAALVVVLALATQLQSLGAWMTQTYVGEKLALGFRAKLFACLQRLSLSFHDSRGFADVLYRVQYDAPAIQRIAVHGVMPFVTASIKVLAMVYVMALLERRLALVALVIIPVLLVLVHLNRSRLRGQWRRTKELQSSAMSVVHESLSAVRVVKAFGQEQREHDRYVDHAEASLLAQVKAVFSESGFNLMIGMTTAAGTATVLFLGARSVLAGQLSLGNLLLIMAYLTQLYAPLKKIGQKIGSLQKALSSAERAFALLDEDPEVVERADARPLDRAVGEIVFRDVAFAYEHDNFVLEDISVEIPAGARVGIVGRTGAGKTTLLSLLPRFYDVVRGRILLDGVDLRDYRLADLRKQFSIVLQEPLLFSTTIEENIAYGRPEASHAEIVEAARSANAHEFIEALPEGYRTRVGERGMRLSGGERQRVSIARAFLKQAPLLLLDEPTSSIDVDTEAGVMDALERLMHARTTFIIAHRLGTLDGCDFVLEIANGRVRSQRPGSRSAPDGAPRRASGESC